MQITSEPISVTVKSIDGGRYKSLEDVEWSNIPGFAIITGRNGSGKTQLLELLSYHLTQSYPYSKPLGVSVNLEGASYEPSEVAYVPSGGRFSGGPAVSIGTMHMARQQVRDLAQQIHNQQQIDPAQLPRHKRALKLLQNIPLHQLTQDDLEKLLPDDFRFALDDVDVTAGLAYVFVAHRLKVAESREIGTIGFDRAGKEIGPAPWDVVNDALRVAGFPFEVISPEGTSLLSPYKLSLKDKNSGHIIDATDLSSGEKVLLQLTLWLYSSSLEGIFPRILLLDEPDAHLHPSMTTQFIRVIDEVLVKKYGIRVIITTHSPSTVALAPEGSVFQMERGNRKITEPASRSDIISVLTAGLVTVTPSMKLCFVEDHDDVAFYQAVHAVLSDFGPSRDPMALQPSPPIAFIAASVGQGPRKQPGGSSVVPTWLEKFDREPLDKIFLGIIDRDTSNISEGRVHVIGRYSFENYLLDPLNVFGLLLSAGRNPTIADLNIQVGDEHLLRSQPNNILQAAADSVVDMIETQSPALKGGIKTEVKYTGGQTISCPKWVIDRRGHDLQVIVQNACGGPRLINPPRLIETMRRVRLIPKELSLILQAIQNY